ncbi:leucine-rich repeat domain-containing protein [Chryseobacterium sp. RP-3-3]|uniref:Leucine-rich repeat domain-containing protein n=1 Tax=Chryseobacterium antibioticum TaxID=2728847 RepID=A0A7Y0FSI8_9FLAO|nr:leucine-rich repeat domain-containing protein [Chryseobacterium antibioticum]NML71352.1 leucine-rich repeat domain-containing protein [Chryseobacterium antibioticum]
MKTKEELRLLFENGDKPTQEDFWALLDSYWHKSEKLGNNALDLITYEEFIYSPTDNMEIIGIDSVTVFPEGIKIIGGLKFAIAAKNRISKIQFPSSLERIRAYAFTGQYLTGALKIPGSCKVIESTAFSSAVANISELILENGVETIADGAFQISGSKNLTELYIPKSVKSVGQNAFNIPSLKKVSALSGLDLSSAGIPETATIMRYFDL